MRLRTIFSFAAASVVAVAGVLVAGISTADADTPVYRIVNRNSGKCLDVAGSSQANGAKVQQYTCNHTEAQQWYVTYTESEFRYTFRNVSSGKCLDVAGRGTANGTKVQQYTCNGTIAQDWFTFVGVPGTGPIYTWVGNVDGVLSKVLEVPSASKANGVGVNIWDSNGTNTQAWSIIRD